MEAACSEAGSRHARDPPFSFRATNFVSYIHFNVSGLLTDGKRLVRPEGKRHQIAGLESSS